MAYLYRDTIRDCRVHRVCDRVRVRDCDCGRDRDCDLLVTHLRQDDLLQKQYIHGQKDKCRQHITISLTTPLAESYAHTKNNGPLKNAVKVYRFFSVKQKINHLRA